MLSNSHSLLPAPMYTYVHVPEQVDVANRRYNAVICSIKTLH